MAIHIFRFKKIGRRYVVFYNHYKYQTSPYGDGLYFHSSYDCCWYKVLDPSEFSVSGMSDSSAKAKLRRTITRRLKSLGLWLIM